MPIIRQIRSLFAVPDMRNFGSIQRLMLFAFACVLLFPLLVASLADYGKVVYVTAAWAGPTLLLLVVAGYLSGDFLAGSRFAVPIAYGAGVGFFVLVDHLLLGELLYFWQHFWQFNSFLLMFMYSEGVRRRTLTPALSEARLTALTARIRPHFLFNSLNAAISLIRLRPKKIG